jgi:hypothetical protein
MFCYNSKSTIDNDIDTTIDNTVSRVPLSLRGWSDDKRLGYIDIKKNQYSSYVKDAFTEKRVTPGITKELIVFMYGYPNKNVGDTLWFYLDYKNNVLLKLKFNYNDQVVDYYNR